MPKLIPFFALMLFALFACNNKNETEQLETSDVIKQSQGSATVYTAAQIITMQENTDVALQTKTAVAVQDDKIIAVGSEKSIRADLINYELTVDRQFQEKVIMPGFIDNHLHPTLAGILLPSEFITPFDWELPGRSIQGVQDKESYMQRLVEVEAGMDDPQQVLVTWGYHQYFHSDLSRAEIDTLSETRPIIVWHRSFHEVILNSAALKALKLNENDLSDHPSIDYARGHFWETGLFQIFPQLSSIILQPKRLTQGMHDGLLHAQLNGITSVADQGAPMFNLDTESALLQTVLQDSVLALRMMIVGNGLALGAESHQQGLATLDALPARNNEQLQYLPKQVKLLADGAFYSQLMQMEDGYLDGHHGEWIMPPEDMEKAASIYWNAGYQLHIHVNGDLGVNTLIDIIERLQQENPRPDHRTVFHHYGYSSPEHAKRLAELGIIVSANPFYLWALGDKYSEIGLGPERAHYIARLGDLEKNNVSVSFHSDLPMAPAAPLTLAGIAASRQTAKGNVLAPEEKMSIDAALRGITIEAARAIQQEQLIGSIEVGKYADFTILEQNPLALDATEFKNIQVWGTVLGGAIHPRERILEALVTE